MTTKVKVVQDAANLIPIEVIAESIKAISEGIRKLRSGSLNDKALVLLIQNAAPCHGGKYGISKMSMKDVRAVLEGIESLEATYLKKKPYSDTRKKGPPGIPNEP